MTKTAANHELELRISLRIDEERLEAVKLLAALYNRSVGGQIRQWIDEGIAREESGSAGTKAAIPGDPRREALMSARSTGVRVKTYQDPHDAATTLTVEGHRVKSVEREEPAKSEFRRVYYCSTCRRLHFRDSKIGKAHEWFEREAAERV